VAHRIDETLLGGEGATTPLRVSHRHSRGPRQPGPSVLCSLSGRSPQGTVVSAARSLQAELQPPGGRERDRLLPSPALGDQVGSSGEPRVLVEQPQLEGPVQLGSAFP